MTIPSSASHAAAASSGRPSGDLASIDSSHAARSGSRSGFTSRGLGSGSLTCWSSTATGVSAVYGTRPTSISYAITPTA